MVIPDQNKAMEQLHTPGPWSIFDSSETISVDIGAKANGRRPNIVDWAGFDSCGLPIEQRRANARLISAAPDLLAALKEFLEMAEEPPETACSCHIAPPCGDCVDHSGLRRAFKAARNAIAKAEGGGS